MVLPTALPVSLLFLELLKALPACLQLISPAGITKNMITARIFFMGQDSVDGGFLRYVTTVYQGIKPSRKPPTMSPIAPMIEPVTSASAKSPMLDARSVWAPARESIEVLNSPAALAIPTALAPTAKAPADTDKFFTPSVVILFLWSWFVFMMVGLCDRFLLSM